MAPITTRIFVRNLAYSVDEQKLQEVFSTSGRIVFAQLMRDEDGHSKGMGLVEFTHPVEALQAMVMMKEAKLYGRHLIVCQDRVGPSSVTQTGFTQGLVDVSGGIGKNGTKVRVDFIEGNSVIHSPDCTAVSDTPITYKEATDFFTGKKVLRGIVRLQMTDISSRWARTSPAQTFFDNMMANTYLGLALTTPHFQGRNSLTKPGAPPTARAPLMAGDRMSFDFCPYKFGTSEPTSLP